MSNRNSRVVRNRERNEKNFSENLNNIRIKIGVIAIIVIIVLTLIVVFAKRNHRSSRNVTIGEIADLKYEYFMLTSKDNIGVIDKKGNKIIDSKYVEINIPNPAKDVFVCYTDDRAVVLNKDEKEIFTNYENVEPVSSSGETIETARNVLKYQKDDLYGLIDLDGNQITEPIYQEISSLNYKLGAILVKKDDKYGILDENGNIVIDIEYDKISSDGFSKMDEGDSKAGFIVVKKTSIGDNYGYIDYKGNNLLDTKYEWIERALEYDKDETYLIVQQNGKKGVYKNKKKIIDCNFQNIEYSNLSDIFIVDKNGKYGFYNLDGKVILKPEYTKYSIAGNYISVEKDDETKLFDINANLVNTNSYVKMIETENPSYFIAETEDGYYSIISKDVEIDEKFIQLEYAFDNYFIFTDKNGKNGVINVVTKEKEIEPDYDMILVIEGTNALQAINGIDNETDIYSKDLKKTVSMENATVENEDNGYAILYSDKDLKYINSDGNVVENTEVYPNEKLYAIKKDDKWGFADKKGKVVVKCEYDIVTELNEYGFAGIKKDGKWGVIDEKGEVIVQPQYELENTYYFPQFIGKYVLNELEVVYCEEI